MEYRLLALTTVGVLALTAQTFGCSVASNWVERSMQWILYRSDVVLYGKDIGRFEVDDGTGSNRTDMTFRVYCIIKGDDKNISENVTVVYVEPLDSCMSDVIEHGKEAIVGLKRTILGNFVYHQIEVMQDVAFKPTKENFKLAYEVCGLQDPQEPSDRPVNATYPQCPKREVTFTTGPPCTNVAHKHQHSSVIVTFIAGLYFLF